LVLAILFWPGIGIDYCNTFTSIVNNPVFYERAFAFDFIFYVATILRRNKNFQIEKNNRYKTGYHKRIRKCFGKYLKVKCYVGGAIWRNLKHKFNPLLAILQILDCNFGVCHRVGLIK